MKYQDYNLPKGQKRRSRKGAWIEILVRCRGLKKAPVAPVRERGLKSWPPSLTVKRATVAPVRERGLKCSAFGFLAFGSGRSRKGAWIEIK